MARVRSIGVRCSILESQERESARDLEAMKVVLEVQTNVINLEAQVVELRTIVLKTQGAMRDLQEPQGNTLGDPILAEDSEEGEEEEVEVVKARPQVVTELVLIEDE